MANKKRYVPVDIATALGFKVNEQGKYRLSPEKWEQVQELKRNIGLLKAQAITEVVASNIPYYWDKTKEISAFVKNPLYTPDKDLEAENVFDTFLSNFSKLVESIDPLESKETTHDTHFDKLVFTDVHIGMNPNPDGYSLYGGKWDETEINKRFNDIYNLAIANQKSNVLYIDDLGDYLDGWDAKTVRREHDLPQNMDNQKAFDVAVKTKINLVESLLKHYDKIHLHNICEDNHAGAFGYVVNSAVKMYLEAKHPNVTVSNQRKFIDHYTVNGFTFITSHGKDSKNLRFGFKPFLDSAQIEKIHNYIFENRLNTGNKIEFLKGDSHQCIFDESSSDLFNYYNFPALSPSSNWVQTNFKRGKSGFFFFNYYDDTKTVHSKYFDWVI